MKLTGQSKLPSLILPPHLLPRPSLYLFLVLFLLPVPSSFRMRMLSADEMVE